MKMKLWWLAGLLAGAAHSLPAVEPHVTLDLGVTSDYVFRGIKKADTAFTNGVQWDGADFYAGLYGVETWKRNALRTEVDFYLGRKNSIDEHTSYDVGLTAYWFPDRDSRGTRYSFEGYAGLTRKLTAGWSASLYGYYDVNRQAVTAEGSTGYAVALTEQATLRLSGFFGTVSARDFYPEFPGPHIRDSYSYYGFTADVPVKISDRATFIFGLKYGDNLNLKGGRPVSDTTYAFGRIVLGF